MWLTAGHSKMPKVLNKRGTRAELNTAAAANQLSAGEVYLITDENRLAVGLTTSTYETYAKASEAGGGGTSSGFETNFLLMGA